MNVRPVDNVVGILAVDNLGPFGWQKLIERALVLGTRFPVDGNEEPAKFSPVIVLLTIAGMAALPLE